MVPPGTGCPGPPGLPAKPWVREVMKKPKLLLGRPIALRLRLLSATEMVRRRTWNSRSPSELGLAAQWLEPNPHHPVSRKWVVLG